MSVLAGILNFDAEPVDRAFLTRVSLTTSEFGPDGESIHFIDSVGMLYRPFHTTPESRLEKQPYTNADGTVVSWDGRLDNRDILLADLGADLKDDSSDAAIATAAWTKWKKDSPAKLIGDWALAIWNPVDRELVLARDRMGIRHLFYHLTHKNITWCTHLSPLALSGKQLTVSDEYIAGYIGFEPAAHLTPYCEIRSVPPGHFICIREGTATSRSYWIFNPRLKIRYKTDAEYEEHYRYLFRRAVRQRMRTDQPILAELSGGYDSTSIVCMADSIMENECVESPRLDTFSYYDSNEPDEDDLFYFSQVEEKRGRQGLRFDLKGCGDSLPIEGRHFTATPGFSHRSEIQSALSMVFESGQYRVVLCGSGGDEMNGQALDPRIQIANSLAGLRLVDAAKHLMSWSLLLRKPLISLLFQSLLELLPISTRARLTPRGGLDPWIPPTFGKAYGISLHQLEMVEGYRFLGPAARDALQTIATLSRRMSNCQPSRVERRYPYLDQSLVEFLTSIPHDQLLRPGHRRSLMRRSLRHLLPAQVLARKSKASATRCYCVSLAKHWHVVEKMFREPLSSRLGYIDKDQMLGALRAMKNGAMPIYVVRLLKAFALEVWLQNAVTLGVITAPQSQVTRDLPMRSEVVPITK